MKGDSRKELFSPRTLNDKGSTNCNYHGEKGIFRIDRGMLHTTVCGGKETAAPCEAAREKNSEVARTTSPPTIRGIVRVVKRSVRLFLFSSIVCGWP